MLYNPYASADLDGMKWRKANFHTHAGVCEKGKCGILPMKEVVAAYAAAKYEILTLSNHDRFLPRLSEAPQGLSLIDGIEYSAHPHMLLIGTDAFETESHQAAIDRVNALGGFAVLCHPNWQRQGYWSRDMLADVAGYIGMEILNPVIYRLSGSGLALDAWDYVLSLGRRVYGFGNDDFHAWHDIARAWNMVCSRGADLADVREAVCAGRTYVSTGVDLDWLKYDGETLRLAARHQAPSYVDAFEYKFVGQGGAALHECRGREAAYAPAPDTAYVRVEVTAENGAKMYLQPLTNEAFFKTKLK